MKRFLIYCSFWFLGILAIQAQNSQLAKQYFDDGEFEKALAQYQELYNKQPYNTTWLGYMVQCYQQMENYDEAETLLKQQLEKARNPLPLVEIDLGHNYILKGDDAAAKPYFAKAIAYISENPGYAGTIGYKLHNYSLLDEAIEAYELGMQLDPKLNYNYALATIYGEQGNLEKMFSTYLTLMKGEETMKARIKYALGQFITDDADSENNKLLRKLLLLRLQQEPDVLWNELLSWLFVQQEQYDRAFMQEKAIYKRTNELTLDRLTDLALSATEDKDLTTAIDIYNYIIENSAYNGAILEAELAIIDLKLEDTTTDTAAIEKKYEALMETYGLIPQTIELHIAYAHFVAFTKNNPEKGIMHLKKVLAIRLQPYEEALVKMELADILVYVERFNEALIYYAQIQKKMKNDVMGQMAMFKVAQTSFYKGDFAWAENQLNILKQSTSQLIANDALQLKLLISDNSQEDSLQVALKIYAKADLMAYQHKDDEAIRLLDSVLTNHKGESIEDEALYKQAKLFEKRNEYQKAVTNYEKMLAFFEDDILTDDALFSLAKLYEEQLQDSEKAKEYYEKIILEHEDSIYLVAARKAYRKLRGDHLGT